MNDYDDDSKLKLLFANSIVAFILAFFIIYIPSQFIVHWVAHFFNIPTQFERFKLIFPILNHSYLWTQYSVVSIYATTPVFAFLIAIFSRILFLRKHLNFAFSKNLLLIWLNAIGIHFFFGSLMVGIPIVQDFGYVPDWLYFPEWIKYGLIILSFLVLLKNGSFIRHAIEILYFDERQLHRPYYSLLFKWYIIFGPAVLVIFSFIILGFPTNTLFMRLFFITFFVQLIAVIPFHTLYKPIENIQPNITFDRLLFFVSLFFFILLILWKLFHNVIFPIPTDYMPIH